MNLNSRNLSPSKCKRVFKTPLYYCPKYRNRIQKNVTLHTNTVSNMVHAHLFNPENDIMLQWPAEVSIQATHTLSPAVNAFRTDGAMLPIWWANKGDVVIVPDNKLADNHMWLTEMQHRFPALCGISAATKCSTSYHGAPWGWSGDAARYLKEAGATVPSTGQLEKMRQLSHRRTSIAVMQHLHNAMPQYALPPVPEEITSIGQLKEACRSAIFLKSPWSSSGRGVARFQSLTPQAIERASGIIRKQGSVMVEHALDCIQDFAMLYRMDGGMATWMGYSLFFNSHGTSYGGNLMTDDESIENHLTTLGADRATLHCIKTELARALSDIIGHDYTGWPGVDMLITGDGMIAPCIEVNLRMTMGVVAHILTERLLLSGSKAMFKVSPRRKATGTNDEVPATVIDGHLINGTLQLVPPAGAFEFSMTVL